MYNENEHIAQRGSLGEQTLPRTSEREQSVPFGDARINCKGEEITQQNPHRSTWGLEGYPLASVYSPIQHFRNLYEPDEALMRGTLFTELDLPFVCGEINGGGGCCGK